MAGAVWLNSSNVNQQAANAETQPMHSLTGTADQGTDFDNVSNTFRTTVESIAPSVVNIRAIAWTDRYNLGFNLPDYRIYDSLRQFFGQQFLDQFFDQRAPSRGYEHRSIGSGVIISTEGHVLTNAHLVGSADEVTVVLHDERTMNGEVVGVDIKTDLALIKIPNEKLSAAKLVQQERVYAGLRILAIGNPFGLAPTVSAGVVATPGRGNAAIAAYEDFLQTDIPIHLANTGGPLVNLQGELIGITTSRPWVGILNPGLGFAVPIRMAQTVMEQLIENGEMRRPSLGVVVQNLTKNLATSFGFTSTYGVLVADVIPNGPAETAGLKSGDIIAKVKRIPIQGVNAFNLLVAESLAGKSIDVEYMRSGIKHIAQVDVIMVAQQGKSRMISLRPKGLGLAIQTLTPEEVRLISNENTRGVWIKHVDVGSMAYRAGLRSDDIIVAVGNQSVTNVEEFHTAIRERNLSEGVRIQIISGGTRRFVYLKRFSTVKTETAPVKDKSF
jgi:serine protease Do